MHDRLNLLSACHGQLAWLGLTSLEAFRAAPPAKLARMTPQYRTMVRRLVDAGNPDVLLALWPRGSITWLVAGITGQPTTRLLSAKRGPLGQAGGELLKLSYDCADADAERRAWIALRDVLRGVR